MTPLLTLFGASAAGLIAAVIGLSRRRRAHEPRAIALVLALPPAPPTLLEQVMRGAADFRGGGICVWCRGPWEACVDGCRARRRPIAMQVAGPGRQMLG